MTDKRKMQDKRIWQRMGLELAALRELIVEIQCDREYNAVMDVVTWDRLDKLTYHLDVVRSRAEDRMARYVPNWTTRTFYPIDRKDTTAAGDAFRQRIKEAAHGE